MWNNKNLKMKYHNKILQMISPGVGCVTFWEDMTLLYIFRKKHLKWFCDLVTGSILKEARNATLQCIPRNTRLFGLQVKPNLTPCPPIQMKVFFQKAPCSVSQCNAQKHSCMLCSDQNYTIKVWVNLRIIKWI